MLIYETLQSKIETIVKKKTTIMNSDKGDAHLNRNVPSCQDIRFVGIPFKC